MRTQAYTEEEFKKILKNLFAEKRRVRELQQQLEESSQQNLAKKFQTKIAETQKGTSFQEMEALKAAYDDKQQQLEKVKPALKKLVEELNEAKSEIEELKLGGREEEVEALKTKVAELEEGGEQIVLRGDILCLEEEIEKQKGEREELEKEKIVIEARLQELSDQQEGQNRELDRYKEQEQKEQQRFEAEKQRLIERLADGLSQIQRQAEIIKDLREEGGALRRELEEVIGGRKNADMRIDELKTELSQTALESTQLSSSIEKQLIEEQKEKESVKVQLEMREQELAREREGFATRAALWEEKEQELADVKEKLLQATKELEESDIGSLKEELESKLKIQKEEAEQIFSQLNKELTQVIAERDANEEKAKELHSKIETEAVEAERKNQEDFDKVQDSFAQAQLQIEERDAEIRKAQQHLAKKVKEATILHDLVERQKVQLVGLQNELNAQRGKIERLESSQNLQKAHEEKMQSMADERIKAAEVLAKEWQEKYFSLHQSWQETKGQLLEFQKMKKNYEQLSSTLSNIKNALGQKSDESGSEE